MRSMIVQGIHHGKLLRVLFDTGSDITLINKRALPKNAKPSIKRDQQAVTGVHGTKPLNREVFLEDTSFPEFSPTQKVPGPIRATVFDNEDSAYDIIVGMDLMQTLGIDVRCKTKTVEWNDMIIPFRPRDYFRSPLLAESLMA